MCIVRRSSITTPSLHTNESAIDKEKKAQWKNRSNQNSDKTNGIKHNNQRRNKNGMYTKRKTDRRNYGTKRSQGKSNSPTHARATEIPFSEQSKFLALDCEMVGVDEGGMRSALARVSIIDYNNAVVFDSFIKVEEPVTDYRTFVSGITEEDLKSDHAIDFALCQSIVKKIIDGKILVGHAIKNDLSALKVSHPWHDRRDTAKYEPFMRTDESTNALRPMKLRDLVKVKLHRDIQKHGQQHCPIEDATAALDLYKKVWFKWEKVMEYKLNRTREIENKKSHQ